MAESIMLEKAKDFAVCFCCYLGDFVCFLTICYGIL